MTNPAALLRSIRLALEQHRDGADFRDAVKRILAEHDTPSLFGDDRAHMKPEARPIGAPPQLETKHEPRSD